MPRPRTFDEADVIACARRAFAETGSAGTSLDDLLGATGLARQSPYNTFGGKELFMRAFLSDAAGAQAAGEIDAAADADSLGACSCAVLEGMSTHGGSGVPRATLLDIGSTSLAAVPISALGREHLGTDDGDWS